MGSFDDQESPAHELARSRRMLTVEDVDLIGSVVRAIPEGEYAIIIDLGEGSGTTALAALCARPERLRVFSFYTDKETRDSAQEAIANAGFRDQWRGFELAGHLGVRYWEVARRRVERVEGWIGVDVLLHNVDHEEGDIARDIRAWAPKLIPGAGIWIHDYGDAPDDWGTKPYPRVRGAVDGLVTEGILKPGEIAGMGWSGIYVPQSQRPSRRARRAAQRERAKADD